MGWASTPGTMTRRSRITISGQFGRTRAISSMARQCGVGAGADWLQRSERWGLAGERAPHASGRPYSLCPEREALPKAFRVKANRRHTSDALRGCALLTCVAYTTPFD